jgi:hypothetical protein
MDTISCTIVRANLASAQTGSIAGLCVFGM